MTLAYATYARCELLCSEGIRSTNARSTGPQGPLLGAPRALTRRDTLIEMRTDVNATRHTAA